MWDWFCDRVCGKAYEEVQNEEFTAVTLPCLWRIVAPSRRLLAFRRIRLRTLGASCRFSDFGGSESVRGPLCQGCPLGAQPCEP